MDCSNTIEWNGGEGFEPIGNSSNKFTGNLMGNTYSISNLYIDKGTNDHVGIFGVIEGGRVSNLRVLNLEFKGKNFYRRACWRI